MRDAGVLLTTGTDLTNLWIIPGEGLHQEFQLLVAAGLSPAEVLSMTGENAALAWALERCGRDRSWPSGRPQCCRAQIHWRTSAIPGASAGSCRQPSACLMDQRRAGGQWRSLNARSGASCRLHDCHVVVSRRVIAGVALQIVAAHADLVADEFVAELEHIEPIGRDAAVAQP
jgi:hypothetical protein